MDTLLQVILYIILVVALLWLGARVFLRGPDLGRYDQPAGKLASTSDRPGEDNKQISLLLKDLEGKIQAAPRKARLQTIRELVDKGFTDVIPEDQLGVERRNVDAGGVPAEWVLAADADPNRRLLYIHGGAFYVGSPSSHRTLTAALSRTAGVAVLAIDYRLMPEHPRMASIEDCQTAWRWMLEHGPNEPNEPNDDSAPADAYVAGDSAGGNLTLTLIAWIRDHGLRQADAAVALSPITDSTYSSPSMRSNIVTDEMLGPMLGPLMRVPRWALAYATLYLARMKPQNPLISPIFGDLANLPPTLIQASTSEMLTDDCRRYVNKAREAGSPAELQLWPEMVHVWQLFEPVSAEAREAIGRIAEFLSRHSGRRESAAA
ncbi:alpha/beta hydrolase [Lentisalinibacter salinarum]|uniref:alpha/beta hydrolase n=1 Tax=Lentisalinibacter salinarum TaxID=2992239 RepID=UPI00386E1126